MTPNITVLYTRVSNMIMECKSISHLFVTRRYLKAFESQVAHSRPDLIHSLNEQFQAKKRSIVIRHETRNPKTKKTDPS